MGDIVIAMPKHEDANRIRDAIKRSGLWEEIVICSSGAETLRIIENQDVSLVICMKSLGDMRYEELANYISSRVNILLLTKDATLAPFSSSIVKLLIPFRPSDLIASVKTLLPSSYYERRKNTKPKQNRSPEEKKILDKAQGILMERNLMTEPEAFRYIQKSSMDAGRTLIESAQMIITMSNFDL